MYQSLPLTRDRRLKRNETEYVCSRLIPVSLSSLRRARAPGLAARLARDFSFIADSDSGRGTANQGAGSGACRSRPGSE